MSEEEKMKTVDEDAVEPGEGVDPAGSSADGVEDDSIVVNGNSAGDETVDPASEGDASEAGEEDDDKVIWDVVFLDGHDPVLVMALESDPEVASATTLTREDVDRLVRSAHKVERHYSASYRWGRRVKEWAMRRKYFAFGTLAVVAFVIINIIINNV